MLSRAQTESRGRQRKFQNSINHHIHMAMNHRIGSLCVWLMWFGVSYSSNNRIECIWPRSTSHHIKSKSIQICLSELPPMPMQANREEGTTEEQQNQKKINTSNLNWNLLPARLRVHRGYRIEIRMWTTDKKIYSCIEKQLKLKFVLCCCLMNGRPWWWVL